MRKVTRILTNTDIVNIWKSLAKTEASSGGSFDFKYSVAMNKAILKPSIEAIDKLSVAEPKFLEFQNKYLELLKKYEADQENFEPEFVHGRAELEKEYQDVINARAKQAEAFNKFMVDTQSIEFFTFTSEDIKDSLSNADPKMVTPGDFANLMVLAD